MRSRSAVMCIVLVAGLSAAALCLRWDSQPPLLDRRSEPRVDDLNTSVEVWLRALPGVTDVQVQRVEKPTHRIIHLRDWHYISKELFAIDMRNARDHEITEEEIDRLYREFLEEVDAVQTEQMTLLQILIENDGLKRIFCEGLTQQGVSNYREKIAVLKGMEANQITRLRKQLGEVRQLLAETQLPELEGYGESGPFGNKTTEPKGRNERQWRHRVGVSL